MNYGRNEVKLYQPRLAYITTKVTNEHGVKRVVSHFDHTKFTTELTPNWVHAYLTIRDELKSHGVPLMGAMMLASVSYGKLTLYEDGRFWVYDWIDEEL